LQGLSLSSHALAELAIALNRAAAMPDLHAQPGNGRSLAAAIDWALAADEGG
jgi:hypothetical protein